jgi:hypothetical protein
VAAGTIAQDCQSLQPHLHVALHCMHAALQANRSHSSYKLGMHDGVYQPGSDGSGPFSHRCAAHAVYRTILPELADMFDWLDLAPMKAGVRGGTLACPWQPWMLLLPAMIESLPPLERLVISGKHIQPLSNPYTPVLQPISNTMASGLTLHTTERRVRGCPVSHTATLHSSQKAVS